MPRPRSPNRDKAWQLWLESNKKRPLKDIAAELGVSDADCQPKRPPVPYSAATP